MLPTQLCLRTEFWGFDGSVASVGLRGGAEILRVYLTFTEHLLWTFYFMCTVTVPISQTRKTAFSEVKLSALGSSPLLGV